jgi:hypothetical protein
MGRAEMRARGGTMEAGVVEVVGIAEEVDGSRATGAGEVETMAEGVEGAVERGRDARRRTL